jgi:immune inhibitor A
MQQGDSNEEQRNQAEVSMYRAKWIHLLSAFLLALLPMAALAVPADPTPVTLVQPNGYAFQARQWGDEFLHGWETLDGWTVVLDEARGAWVYAERAGSGELVPGVAMVGMDPPPAHLSPHLRPGGTSLQRPQLLRSAMEAEVAVRVPPTSGVANVPVILVNFADRTPTYAPSDFNSLLFGSGTWSMKDYYQEVSYGQFSVSAGPSGVTGWYTAAHGHDYYGANNASGDDSWPGDLVYEAAAAADAAGFNFAAYDNDGDCTVDALVVVHQGSGEEASGVATDIWSHRWSLSGAYSWGASHYGPYTTNDVCSAGGYVRVNDYTIQPELYSDGLSTVGVFVHEYGHVLGLPDLYDTDYSSAGVGKWSVMAGGSWCGIVRGGDRPSHMDPWCKRKLGWVVPQEVTGTLPAEPIVQAATAADVYQLLPGNPTVGGEYFLVENRQLASFDAGLPGSGLLIWHIDEAKAGNTGECYPGGPSCTTQHYKVAVEQADGLWELEKGQNRGNAGDPYPGSSAKTRFDGTSTPSSALYSGTASGVSVTDISASGSTMTATLSLGGGGGSTVTIYQDGFEGGFPGPWSVSGSTTWGRSTYRAATGTASAWCAAGGSAPAPPGGPYLPNMWAWMKYGPFSLADATAARMEFDLWFDTESSYDKVWWAISIDGNEYWGYYTSGYSGGWQHVVFDFSDVTAITAVGQPQVWVAFVFESDYSVQYEGAYVDNVVISKTISCDLVLSNQTVSTSMTYESCGSLAAGPSFAVVAPGNLTLRAANRVVLRNGFSVGQGARLAAGIDPSLSP